MRRVAVLQGRLRIELRNIRVDDPSLRHSPAHASQRRPSDRGRGSDQAVSKNATVTVQDRYSLRSYAGSPLPAIGWAGVAIALSSRLPAAHQRKRAEPNSKKGIGGWLRHCRGHADEDVCEHSELAGAGHGSSSVEDCLGASHLIESQEAEVSTCGVVVRAELGKD